MAWFVIALLMFWAMGAYNRLMRLRTQCHVAFSALALLFNQYVSMVNVNFQTADEAHLIPATGQGIDAFFSARIGLVSAAEQFAASLKVAHAHPLRGPTMQALKTALEILTSSWCRLLDLPPDLAGPALPGTLQVQWEHVALQVGLAQTEFNRQVESYNDAIDQFPAVLLARLFGFKPAQPI